MWAIEYFGLTNTADKYAIKSAYAARLKKTRPDENPVEFQKLHEAYQAALKWSEYYAEELTHSPQSVSQAESIMLGDSNEITITEELLPVQDNHLSPNLLESFDDEPTIINNVFSEPTFDFPLFYKNLIEFCEHGDDQALSVWLGSIPELWALDCKEFTGHLLVNALQENTPPLYKTSFDIIFDFFGFHEVNSHIDDYVVWYLRGRLHGAWIFKSKQIIREDKQKAHGFFAQRQAKSDRRLIEQLEKPLSWMQLFLATFPPWKAIRWRKRTNQMLIDTDWELPESVNLEQVDYWSTISMGRFPSIMSTYILILLLFTLFSLTRLEPFLFNITSSEFLSYILIKIGKMFPAFVQIIMGMYYFSWLRMPYHTIKNTFLRQFSIAWIPLLCVLSVLTYLSPKNYTMSLLFWAMLSAFWRYYHHFGIQPVDENNFWRNIATMILFVLGSLLLVLIFFATVRFYYWPLYWSCITITLVVWWLEYRKQSVIE